MRKIVLYIVVLLSVQLSAQKKVTSNDWQSDLSFLQETVHESFPFLFKKVKAKDFDEKIKILYDKVPQLEAHEVVVEFAKIIASFKYGHTKISFRNSPVKIDKMPLQIYQFLDGVYITGAHKQYSNILGGKILSIEGKPIQQVFEMIYDVVPVENDYYFKAYGISYALIPQILHNQGVTKTLKKEIIIKIEKEGKLFEVKVKAISNISFPIKYGEVQPKKEWISVRNQSNSPLYLKNLDKRYFFKYLQKKKTVYVRYSQVLNDPSESISSFYNRVFEFIEKNEVEKFVLDIRLNSGGNNYFNKQLITKVIEHKKINQEKKFFVIIGRRTFSAAQNLVNQLDNYTNVTFAGEPTSENINFFGDVKRLRLPKSGLNIYLSFAWWQDKPQWENRDYMTPDILVKTSFLDYKLNRDVVLEKILSIKNN